MIFQSIYNKLTFLIFIYIFNIIFYNNELILKLLKLLKLSSWYRKRIMILKGNYKWIWFNIYFMK